MKLTLKLTAILIFLFSSASDIVRRHDIDDFEYIELGEKYGATVSKFNVGCGTLIRPNWVMTAVHVV